MPIYKVTRGLVCLWGLGTHQSPWVGWQLGFSKTKLAVGWAGKGWGPSFKAIQSPSRGLNKKGAKAGKGFLGVRGLPPGLTLAMGAGPGHTAPLTQWGSRLAGLPPHCLPGQIMGQTDPECRAGAMGLKPGVQCNNW